jgi:hypothetical protein
MVGHNANVFRAVQADWGQFQAILGFGLEEIVTIGCLLHQ